MTQSIRSAFAPAIYEFATHTAFSRLGTSWSAGSKALACSGVPSDHADVYKLRARTAGRSAGEGRRRALAGRVTTATVLPVMSKDSTE